MSTTQIPTAQASGLTTEHLVKALASAAEPKPAKWIQDQLPKQLLPKPISQSGPVIEALLESAIEAGQVWRYGKTDKALYWHSAPQAWVQRCLLNKLAGGMKTKSDLIGTVCNLVTVKGVFPKTQVEPVLKELIAAGQILVHPAYAGGRTKLHSLRPADPAD